MWDHSDPRTVDPRERPTRGRAAWSSNDPRDPERVDKRDVFTQGLDLPRGLERERVVDRDRAYELRGSEVRMLATVGAFRVVPSDDLREQGDRPGDPWHGDLDHLRRVGLVRTVAPLDRESSAHVVVLTERGRRLLESHRSREFDPPQRFYARAVKPRELSHDAQLYRAYLRVAERLRERDARVHRVVLDYELKRDYQRFLHERNRGKADWDGRPDRSRAEVEEWARAHDLPVENGRVQFPDVRVEYERSDGRRDVEDIEVMTPHYRGAHASAKTSAGFTRFRFTGMRVGGRASGSSGGSRTTRYAEEFL